MTIAIQEGPRKPAKTPVQFADIFPTLRITESTRTTKFAFIYDDRERKITPTAAAIWILLHYAADTPGIRYVRQRRKTTEEISARIAALLALDELIHGQLCNCIGLHKLRSLLK